MNENPWGESGGAGADKPNSKLSKRSSIGAKLGRSKDMASVGFKKTKVVASVGFEKTKVVAKKVKKGTSVGVNWIKLKYAKSKLFHKK